LTHGDPLALDLTDAIHRGDLDRLKGLVGDRPELAKVRMIGRNRPAGGWRTPLHAAADWPGYFPKAPAVVALLVASGADPDDDGGGDRPETPLHWAASTDDVDVAIALIDAGADLVPPGGSIGTPLANAVGYGCWHVARLLVARGAPVETPWQAAALGLIDRLDELLGPEPTAEAVSQAFWHACSAAQRRAAEHLADLGADVRWIPDYGRGTPLDAAEQRGTRRENVIAWLEERGGRRSGQ
jgi:hypothetical protein